MIHDPNLPLRNAVLDLEAAAGAYRRRYLANGEGHPDNRRLFSLSITADEARYALARFLEVLDSE